MMHEDAIKNNDATCINIKEFYDHNYENYLQYS